MAQERDTDAAAMLLASDVMVTWLVRRALAQEAGAKPALQAHVEREMARVLRVDPGLLAATQAACAVVVRAIGEAPMLVRVQSGGAPDRTRDAGSVGRGPR